MKLGNKSKVLALALSVLMMISVFSFTVSADPTLAIGTITQTPVDDDLIQVEVPFTATDVAQVTLLVVKAADGTTTPVAEEGNIAYIDQVAATAGKFTFKVSKTALGTDKWMHIKVGGTSIADPDKEILPPDDDIPALLGDLDGDKDIDGDDTILHLRRIASIITEFPLAGASGDFDGDLDIDGDDTILHLRRIASIIIKFPIEQ